MRYRYQVHNASILRNPHASVEADIGWSLSVEGKQKLGQQEPQVLYKFWESVVVIVVAGQVCNNSSRNSHQI